MMTVVTLISMLVINPLITTLPIMDIVETRIRMMIM